jgi:hypothetical protein
MSEAKNVMIGGVVRRGLWPCGWLDLVIDMYPRLRLPCPDAAGCGAKGGRAMKLEAGRGCANDGSDVPGVVAVRATV